MTAAIDRSPWGSGPWTDEPDELDWTDPATGYQCAIRRTPELGHLCGYVGVPESHPWHGVDYSDRDPLHPAAVSYWRRLWLALLGRDAPRYENEWEIRIDAKVSVHGGLTWAGALPTEEPDGFWWFGFDCAHLNDFSPGSVWTPLDDSPATYKTVSYVKAEMRRLADQLAEVSR